MQPFASWNLLVHKEMVLVQPPMHLCSSNPVYHCGYGGANTSCECVLRVKAKELVSCLLRYSRNR